MTVFCDNGDCFYIDEDGFCDCDKLSIVGGVCAGSYRSGRNACDGDVDERLKAENAKLRELLRDVWLLFTKHSAVNPCDLPVVDAVRDRMREFEVEVDE